MKLLPNYPLPTMDWGYYRPTKTRSDDAEPQGLSTYHMNTAPPHGGGIVVAIVS